MTARVAVVTDSTADLPPEVAARHGITVVPLIVRFGDEALRDGVDLGPEVFLERLRRGTVVPSTSQPPPEAFVECYTALAARGLAILSVHISARLSGTANAAVLAARQVAGAVVEVVDGRSASMGTGFLALEAAERAARGESLAVIAAAVRAAASRLNVYAALDTLEFLRRGGRIGGAAALLGALLSVKPIITLRDGVVAPLERPRTMTRALQRLKELVEAQAPLERLAILHAGAPELAERLREQLARVAPSGTLTVPIGPTIATHAGPGVVGAVTLRRA